MALSLKQIQQHITRQQAMRRDRTNWETLWTELSDYLQPGRISILNKRLPGQKGSKKIYDNTGALAAQRLAAGLYSRTVNPASKWFFLTPDDKDIDLLNDPEVATWLDTARNTTQATMNKLAAGVFFQTYLDLVNIGTAAIFIDEIPLKGAVYFTYPIDQIDIAENSHGVVDTVYRNFRLTARQLQQDFEEGIADIDEVQKCLKDDKDVDHLFDVMHCVYPRMDRDVDKYDNLNMPIASVYILVGQDKVLRESGYPEMPYVIPRLEVLTGEKYGRGPGLTALPEVKSLNEMGKLRLDNANLRSRPPLDVPLNAYVNPLHLIPGYKNLNQDATGKKATAMTVAGDLSYTTADIKESRNTIREIFYNDQLQLGNGPQMTATEVMKRSELNMQLMGPWQGRLEPEFYEPSVVRTLGINIRQGLIPPPPQALIEMSLDPIRNQYVMSGETKNIKVIYDSPLARAQRMSDVGVIDNVKMSLAQIAAINPEQGAAIAGTFRLDLMEADRARSLGLPNKYLKSPEQLQAEQKAKAKQQQQQQAMQMATQGSEIASNLKGVPGADKLTNKVMSGLSQAGEEE